MQCILAWWCICWCTFQFSEEKFCRPENKSKCDSFKMRTPTVVFTIMCTNEMPSMMPFSLYCSKKIADFAKLYTGICGINASKHFLPELNHFQKPLNFQPAHFFPFNPVQLDLNQLYTLQVDIGGM